MDIQKIIMIYPLEKTEKKKSLFGEISNIYIIITKIELKIGF